METISLTQLIATRIAAKRAEDEAIAERRRIDGVIAELLKDPSKPEGSISQKADGYKVTVTYKIDRKVDTEKLTADWAKLPAEVQSTFKWSASLSVSEFRKLEGKAQVSAARFFESKEASPSIKIETV